MSPLKLGILISGRGSNMESIIKHCKENTIDASVEVVISNRGSAKGLELAKHHGISTHHVKFKEFDSANDYENEIIDKLETYNVDLVVLAGYMKLVGDPLLKRYENKMINIHPSLLPAFKGLNAQEQAINYGVKITGCTVHYVTKEMDAGPIILQAAVPVKEDDTADSLSERILVEEHQLLPAAIGLIAKKTN